MPQGLGKNAPVVLSLGRENYEALIDRHGQWVRWRAAAKCPCVKAHTQQPDIHCKRCGGSGFLYRYQKDYTGTMNVQAIDGIVTIPEEHAHCTVTKLYNYRGLLFPFKQYGRYLELRDTPASLTRGEMLEAVFTESLVSYLAKATAKRVSEGMYRVEGLTVPKSRIQGIYYTPFCDLVSVGSLKDAAGLDVPITGCRKDCVTVPDTVQEPVLYAEEVNYIKPVKFLLLSQNLKKATLDLMHKHSGDAVCTFPYYYDVSEGDVITVLSGTVTQKQIVVKSNDEKEDTLLEYFVDDIISLESMEKVYQKGIDFILAETNRIRWIGDTPPEKGTALSITFTYFPTYRVVKDLPALRTSEDQRIPRKVIVQLLSNFQEQSHIHYNEVSL